MKNIIFLVLQTNGKDSILSLDKISIQILLINIQFIEIIHFITFYFSHTSGVVIWSESYILMRQIRPVFRWPKCCVSTLDHDWVRMVSVERKSRQRVPKCCEAIQWALHMETISEKIAEWERWFQAGYATTLPIQMQWPPISFFKYYFFSFWFVSFEWNGTLRLDRKSHWTLLTININDWLFVIAKKNEKKKIRFRKWHRVANKCDVLNGWKMFLFLYTFYSKLSEWKLDLFAISFEKILNCKFIENRCKECPSHPIQN